MRGRTSVLLRCYIALACVWLLAPIVIVVILAFSGDGYLRFPPSSLSLQWFARFFGDAQWRHAMLSSVIVGVIACVVATTVGLFAAYAFLRVAFPGKKLLLSLLVTPIIVPSIITAIAMYYLSVRLHLVGNLLWLGLCHAVIALPIVVLILLAALQAVDPNLERAALGLGSSRVRMFWRVVLPIALPGVLSAALFAFLASFDELLIALFLSGIRSQTLPVRIWNSLNLQVEPTIAAVSGFLIGVTTLVLAADGLLRLPLSLRGAKRRSGAGNTVSVGRRQP